MAKHILRKTEKKVAVKVNGTGVTETISLGTDCKLSNETLDTTQTVHILSITWMGDANAKATITRGTNPLPIAIVQGNCAAHISLADTEFVDTVDATEDIVITTVGDMQVYLLLRKESGYLSHIDDGLSIYDDPNVAGS